MRWSDAWMKGELGMLGIYIEKEQGTIDEEVFKVYPFLEYWTLTEEGKILYNDLRRLDLYRKPDAHWGMKTVKGENRKGIRGSEKRKRV
ncbi:hypothetical protein ACFLV9_00640 [Chloroflexota bacterium]